MCISFIRIIHDKIIPVSCISCTYHPVIADMFGETSHLVPDRDRIADRRPHRYSTRLNHQRSMDQVQTELAEMRANMAQFMTMMQGVVQGQEELRALAQRLEAVIPPVHRASPVGVPVHENAAVTILVNDYAWVMN